MAFLLLLSLLLPLLSLLWHFSIFAFLLLLLLLLVVLLLLVLLLLHKCGCYSCCCRSCRCCRATVPWRSESGQCLLQIQKRPLAHLGKFFWQRSFFFKPRRLHTSSYVRFSRDLKLGRGTRSEMCKHERRPLRHLIRLVSRVIVCAIVCSTSGHMVWATSLQSFMHWGITSPLIPILHISARDHADCKKKYKNAKFGCSRFEQSSIGRAGGATAAATAAATDVAAAAAPATAASKS
jgi:hypothetical protein